MVLVAAVAVLALAPGAAEAATARTMMVSGCGGDSACGKYNGLAPVSVVAFEAAPGEANRLVLRRDGADVVLRDDGAPVAAGEGCQAVDERTARCPFAPADLVDPLSARLGDGDDLLLVEGNLGGTAQLHGGAGIDTITGGQEAASLFGGPGADRLDGGGGADSLDFSATIACAAAAATTSSTAAAAATTTSTAVWGATSSTAIPWPEAPARIG